MQDANQPGRKLTNAEKAELYGLPEKVFDEQHLTVMPESRNLPRVPTSLQRRYRQLPTGELRHAGLMGVPGMNRSAKKRWLRDQKKNNKFIAETKPEC